MSVKKRTAVALRLAEQIGGAGDQGGVPKSLRPIMTPRLLLYNHYRAQKKTHLREWLWIQWLWIQWLRIQFARVWAFGAESKHLSFAPDLEIWSYVTSLLL